MVRTKSLDGKNSQRVGFEYFDSIKHNRPKESPLVIVLSKEYKRLMKETAAAKHARGEAEFAVNLLSDEYVFSTSKTIPDLDKTSAMFRVCAIPSVERVKRSNLAIAEMVRLESVIDHANNASVIVSEMVHKHLGNVRFRLWLLSMNRIQDVSNHRSDYERWIFPVADLESELSRMNM